MHTDHESAPKTKKKAMKNLAMATDVEMEGFKSNKK